MQKFASFGERENQKDLFSYSSGATSRRSEKIPLNYSQNLFGSTASRAQHNQIINQLTFSQWLTLLNNSLRDEIYEQFCYSPN